MNAEKTLATIDDLSNVPDDGRHELLDGELVRLPYRTCEHGGLIGTVAFLLTSYVRPRRLGRLLIDLGVILGRDPDRVRAPDVAFIARGRLPAGRLPATFSDVVSDLVVEIVSPGDRASKVRQKTEEWLRAGVRLVLTVDPETRTMETVHDLDSARIFHDGDRFTCEPVLPKLTLAVSEIFETDDA